MSDDLLPDVLGGHSVVAVPQSRQKEHRQEWTDEDLAGWLAKPSVAEWVPNWVDGLRRTFGEQLPQLLFRGLGMSDDIPLWMRRDSPSPTWLRRFIAQSSGASAWFEHGFLQDDPAWLTRLLRLERAHVARSFLLTGNITDYAFDPVVGYRPTIRLLIDSLLRTKRCVLTFRLSQGLELHTRNDEPPPEMDAVIQEELDAGALPGDDTSLLTRVCRLFDALRRWLSPAGGSANEEAGVAIIFENIHLLVPSDRTDVERNFLVDNLLHWSISPELFRSNHCLVLTAESLDDVGSELRARGGKIEQILIPRPDSVQARLKFILPLLTPGSGMTETRVARLVNGADWLSDYGEGTYHRRVTQLSHDTAGLTFLGIEDLLQQAAASTRPSLHRDEVMLLKRERLRQESEGLLKVYEPRRTLDSIGGYDSIKQRLHEIIRALKNSDDELIRQTIPMGILFLGPPGTGKSITAEAIAGESRITMAKLGDFRGMYVGQSERNLSRIFQLIEALHPVIVFIDEVDQALGRRGGHSGDGGVDRRIFGKFLEFMSDKKHRGQVLWLGAANHPGEIDPAFKRPGRFDLALPFLLPDRSSRAAILRLEVNRAIGDSRTVRNEVCNEDYAKLADGTKGFSGAELQAIVGEALRRAVRPERKSDGAIVLDGAIFEEVLGQYLPPPGVQGEYDKMTQSAIDSISHLDLIPEEHRHLLRGRVVRPTQ